MQEAGLWVGLCSGVWVCRLVSWPAGEWIVGGSMFECVGLQVGELAGRRVGCGLVGV